MSYYDRDTKALYCQYCGKRMDKWVETREFGWRMLDFSGRLHYCQSKTLKQRPASLGDDLAVSDTE